jgi:hypothetical protein
MKNIHVLPTDKPSRLIKSQDNDLIYLNTNVPNWFEIWLKTTKQNIYITSDEEIKDVRPYEGKWQLEQGQILNKFPTYLTDLSECKLVIMTTDQDLIKDGVQAIDDEFLEWFVKNPSCEKVEFETDIIGSEGGLEFRPFFGYKIIIPRTTQQIIDEDYAGGLDMGQISAKQESKQDRTCSNNCSTICGECQIFEFRPISGLEWLLGYIEELNKKGYKFIPSSKKEIVEHVTQMEKDNMINFLKSVFQQYNFNYEKAYNKFINKKRV